MERFLVKKHWTSFKNGKVIVNCPTEDLAKQFLGYCEEKGINWRSGDPASSKTYFEELGDQLCYDTTLLDGMTRASIWEHQMYAPEIPILQFQGFGSLKKNPEKSVKAIFNPSISKENLNLIKGMIEGKWVLNCKTEEVAKELLKYLDSKGYAWTSGYSLVEDTHFTSYKSETCYSRIYNQGSKDVSYSGSEFYKKEGVVIKEFKGFKIANPSKEVVVETFTYFKCPECGKLHTAEDWDKETGKRFRTVNSILGNRKEDSYFICPTCKLMVDGEEITKVVK